RGRRGLTRVLVEGGARLAGALVKAGLVDRIAWFRAPLLMGGGRVPALDPRGVAAPLLRGGEGGPALDPLGVADPAAAPKWRRTDMRQLGEDTLEYLVRF